MIPNLHNWRRAGLLAALVGGSAIAVSTTLALPKHARLPFTATLVGVSGDSSVWRGEARTESGRRVRLALRHVENPIEAAKPVWHVAGRWAVEAEATAHSFTADLEGLVDWKTGTTRLSGVVGSGWMKGSRVQLIGQFVDADISGTAWLTPEVARR